MLGLKLLGAGGVRVVGVDVEKHTEDRGAR